MITQATYTTVKSHVQCTPKIFFFGMFLFWGLIVEIMRAQFVVQSLNLWPEGNSSHQLFSGQDSSCIICSNARVGYRQCTTLVKKNKRVRCLQCWKNTCNVCIVLPIFSGEVDSLLWIMCLHLSSSWVKNQWWCPTKFLHWFVQELNHWLLGWSRWSFPFVLLKETVPGCLSVFGAVTKKVIRLQVTQWMPGKPLCIHKLYKRKVSSSKIIVIILSQVEPLGPKKL